MQHSPLKDNNQLVMAAMNGTTAMQRWRQLEVMTATWRQQRRWQWKAWQQQQRQRRWWLEWWQWRWKAQQQRDGNEKDNNQLVMATMDSAPGMQWQWWWKAWRQHNGNGDKPATAMNGVMATTMATAAMEGATVMAMEGKTALQRQRWRWLAQWRWWWKAQRQCNGGNGRCNGNAFHAHHCDKNLIKRVYLENPPFWGTICPVGLFAPKNNQCFFLDLSVLCTV